jgi:hypothetical protein
MLEVGKLYSCSGYYLMLYPDRETADAAGLAGTAAAEADPDASTAYWTKKLQKPVSFCNPETPLLVLTVEEKYVEILAGDKVGWAICQRWLDIKEITDAAA